MRSKLICILAACFGLLGTSRGATSWLTDLATGLEQAKADGKLVLVNFTGSDWNGWCITLRNEVFSQPEFDAFAAQHLVLVEVDFPRRKALSAEQRSANENLARQFGLTGLPTIIILDGTGKRLGVIGYLPGGPKPFISVLQRFLDPQAKNPEETKPALPKQPLPLFGGAATQPPPRYTELTLKGISGATNRRMAIVNNQTLGVGEQARVKLGDGEVKVRCLEIADTSVIVMVDGETERRELRLRGGL
jgi:thioredoxin-related protein